MKSIEACRVDYANRIVRGEGSSNQALIDAFATVERERFLGPGPWQIHAGAYWPELTDDPRLLYEDVLVSLAPDRGINNGQPSLHARCIAACAPAPGEVVVHVGAGTGYYSAILAALVGPTGRVLAYEVEADLAEAARRNLQSLANVEVRACSATAQPIPRADIVYVCAGITDPPDSWLDALNTGGRLVFPLTSDWGTGLMLLVIRRCEAGYAARSLMRVSFIACVGARCEASALAIEAALETRSPDEIRSLRRHTPPDASAWCIGAGWWLSTRDLPADQPA